MQGFSTRGSSCYIDLERKGQGHWCNASAGLASEKQNVLFEVNVYVLYHTYIIHLGSFIFFVRLCIRDVLCNQHCVCTALLT